MELFEELYLVEVLHDEAGLLIADGEDICASLYLFRYLLEQAVSFAFSQAFLAVFFAAFYACEDVFNVAAVNVGVFVFLGDVFEDVVYGGCCGSEASVSALECLDIWMESYFLSSSISKAKIERGCWVDVASF